MGNRFKYITFYPVGTRVVIRAAAKEEAMKSGIAIPDMLEEKPLEKMNERITIGQRGGKGSETKLMVPRSY